MRQAIAIRSFMNTALQFCCASTLALFVCAMSPTAREFDFSYTVTTRALPPGSPDLHLWVPLPPSDQYQTIKNLKIESPVTYTIRSEQQYGNRFAHFVVPPERLTAPFQIALHFRVVRREHRVPLDNVHPAALTPLKVTREMRRWLQPDHLVPLDGVIATLAHEQMDDVTDPLQQARKAYEYVIATMKYDKSGDGWGNGDALWACSSKRGNCTDFHSVFIGMLRAKGIPARFEIGFPLPDSKGEGDIPGYHCWAEFYIEGVGWVPVDVSEAWKHPEKREFFFGAHDDNRVMFTRGRDIYLSADQQGGPLNYFVYPYAEMNGRPFSGINKEFHFKDLQHAMSGHPVRSSAAQVLQ